LKTNNQGVNKKWFDKDCVQMKKAYLHSLYNFRRTLSETDRIIMYQKKKLYKQWARKAKWKHKKSFSIELAKLKKSSPREFWKFFRKKKCNNSGNINSEQFYEHFKSLHTNFTQPNNAEVDEWLVDNEQTGNNQTNMIFPQLDTAITDGEIDSAIKDLKSCKQHGVYLLINEYFIYGSEILTPCLNKLFNAILDSGYFPRHWCEGIIVPIYKSGETGDTNNYRGITLLSCLSKLFTKIVNNRLLCWSKEFDKLSDAQFGFKSGVCTIDAIFVLHNIVNSYLSEGKKLYATFVDFKKAFDCVYRDGLWYKVFKSGIQGKVFSVLRSMYSSVKSCIMHLGSLSEYFE
jgi:hypothetical protein